MRDPRSMRPRARRCLVLALVLVVAACGQSEEAADTPRTSAATPSATEPEPAPAPLPTPVQELEINSTEYAFQITPDPAAGVKPGWTLLKFHNIGAEPHQVMFARIKDGVDMAELAAAGAGDSSGAGAIEFVDMIGGVSYIGPGQDTTALVNLTEGVVMAMCYVPDSKGVAHALMGMTAMLTVGAPSGDTAPPGDEPVVGTIEFSEDGYRVPGDLTTGWYHVRNTDSALHEMALLRLDRSIDDEEAATIVGQLAANEVPDVELTAVGGMGAVSSGFDGYLYLALDEGAYLAVDFMPDPGEPRPHMLDGYYTTFST
ncbi:MAG: hypothetical protein KF703_05130 [Actinobacteria bacterium]|nr:hypothetical protein [Actinomycetota bacterium]